MVNSANQCLDSSRRQHVRGSNWRVSGGFTGCLTDVILGTLHGHRDSLVDRRRKPRAGRDSRYQAWPLMNDEREARDGVIDDSEGGAAQVSGEIICYHCGACCQVGDVMCPACQQVPDTKFIPSDSEVTGIDDVVSTGRVLLVVILVPPILMIGVLVAVAISSSIAKFLDALK